jgi:HK97 family phage major capsid protein
MPSASTIPTSPATEQRIAAILADPRSQRLTREADMGLGLMDKDKRTIDLSFASELPVDRWYGREILDMGEGSVDLSRLANAAPLLLNHDWDRQIGVVERAWVDGPAKKARASVRFSRSALGEEIFRDIQDKIRSLVSVGYVVRKMVLESVEGDVETHRATDWQPFEVSIVSVPADTSVGVGRSLPDNTPAAPAPPAPPAATINPTNSRNMETTTTAPDATAVERARVKDINTAADTYISRHQPASEAIRALARKCVEGGETLDTFTRAVINDVLKTDPVAPSAQGNALIGMSGREIKRYSVLRAINLAVEKKPLDGIEREASDEVARKVGRSPLGFFLPDDIIADVYAQRAAAQRRTLLAVSAPDGGYTVGQELLAGEFVEFLRNNTRVIELGARYVSGLVGDVTIPRQLTGATAYWVSETGSITQSSATFGQITAKPRRIGTSVPYSKQFLAQSSLSAESFVVNDSDASIAVDLDRVALRGIGGAEPLGIANLAAADRSTSVTFGAAATWAKYLEFFSSVANNNAILGSPAYVASVASAVKAQTIAKFSNTADPIWLNDMVGVFRARWTTQLLTTATPVANMVIFGDFSQVIFCEWAGRDVVVDPYTGARTGTVEVVIQRLIDCVIRRGKSFAISADSGAQ